MPRLPRFMLRIVGVLLAVFIVVPSAAGVWLAFRPLPIGVVAPILEVALADALSPFRFEVGTPILYYEGGGLVLRTPRVDAYAPNGALVTVENIVYRPSIAGLLDGFLLAPETVTAERMIVQTGTDLSSDLSAESPEQDLDQSLNQEGVLEAILALEANFLRGFTSERATYFRHFSIPQIALIADRHIAAHHIPKSSAYIESNEAGVTFDIVLQYRIGANREGDEPPPINGLVVRGGLLADAPGTAQIRIDQLKPSDLTPLIPVFGVLRGIDLPINADMRLVTGADGDPRTAEIELEMSAGQISVLGDLRDVRIGKSRIRMAVDFPRQRIAITETVLAVEQSLLDLKGVVTYETDANGYIDDFSVALRADALVLDWPGVIEPPLALDKLDLNMEVIGGDVLRVQRLALDYGGPKFTLSGDVALLDDDAQFDLSAQIDPMSLRSLRQLWPVALLPNVQNWFDMRVKGGRVTDGRLGLKTRLSALNALAEGRALPDDALFVDIGVEGVTVDYVSGMPPIEKASARILLGGNHFTAKIARGEGRVKNNDKYDRVQITGGEFAIRDFTAAPLFADIDLRLDGEVAAIIRALRAEPLSLLRDVAFDFERLKGTARGQAELRLPLADSLKGEDIEWRASAETQGFALAGEMVGFVLSDADARFEIDKAGMKIDGTIRANGVPGRVVWEQSFIGDGDTTQIDIAARLDADQLATLGQNWLAQRLRGVADVELLIAGRLPNIRRMQIMADLGASEIRAVPLGYQKAKGVKARADVTLDYMESKLSAIAFDYRANDDRLSGRFDVRDNVITNGRIAPIRLGADNDAKLTFTRTANNPATDIVLRGKKFSLTGLLRPILFPLPATAREDSPDPRAFGMLGADFTIDARIDKARAYNDMVFELLDLKAGVSKSIIDAVNFDAHLPNATVQLDIVRDTPTHRRLTVFSNDAGAILRAANIATGMRGGKFDLVGTIVENHQTQSGARKAYAAGEVEITDFLLQDVPSLAQVLTFGSFTGISDTLAGDGLRFERAHLTFVRDGRRVRFKDGQVSGPAIGITTRGEVDLQSEEMILGGTVTPAYSFNSFLSYIPIIGPILTGRKGEGLFGISYRVAIEDGRLTVTGNPLSLLTPGIFRRIFDIGISLPDPPES